MTRYLLKKLITLLILLFLVSIAVFSVLFVLPGDPAQIILGINATPEQLAQSVDAAIFEQLDLILGRAPKERKRRSSSEATVPDVYFPRDDQGRIISDH